MKQRPKKHKKLFPRPKALSDKEKLRAALRRAEKLAYLRAELLENDRRAILDRKREDRQHEQRVREAMAGVLDPEATDWVFAHWKIQLKDLPVEMRAIFLTLARDLHVTIHTQLVNVFDALRALSAIQKGTR